MDASSRTISQILSKAGLPNAGVRYRGCGGRDTIPAGASGYGCQNMTYTLPGPGGFTHPWSGVEVTWYGDIPSRFEEITTVLSERGYEVSDPALRTSNFSAPGLTCVQVWPQGADAQARAAVQ